VGVIASLIANLKANTADFDSKLKKSASGLKSFEVAAKGVSAGITSAFAKLAVAAGGFTLFRSAIADADKFGELAETLGDSTRNMQALAYAASQNDSSFDAVSSAMVRMQKNIVDADSGNKQLAASFAALGLRTSELMGMNATDQFKAIADALANVDNAAVRTNLGMDIFGKSFSSIAVMVNAGSSAIDDASKKMKAFGLSNEQVAKIKEFNDQLAAFGMQAKAAAAQVVAHLGSAAVKALTGLSESMQGAINWWKNLSGISRQFIGIAAEAVVVTWALNRAMVFSAISKSVDLILSMVSGLRALVTAMRSATIASEVSQAIATGGLSLVKTAAGIAASIGVLALVDRAFASTGEAASANTQAIETNAQAVKKASQEWTEYNRVMAEASEVLKNHQSEIDRINGIINKYVTDAKKLRSGELESQIADIKRVAEAAGMGLGWATAKVRELKEAAQELELAKGFASFNEALAEARNETLRLTKSETELKMIEAERAGLTGEQLLELREVLDYNDRIRKSQEEQKRIEQEKRDAAKEAARIQEEAARKAADQRKRDLDTVQKMEEDASPTLKYTVDKAELDRLKYEVGMSDDAYNFQLKTLQDEMKKSLGMDEAGTGGGRLNQGYASGRSGMLTYALMGGQSNDEKVDRKQMVEYLRIMAQDARDGRGRLTFPN
jgi:hypothetical protein